MADSIQAEVVEEEGDPKLSRREMVSQVVDQIRDDLHHDAGVSMLAMVQFAKVDPLDLEAPPPQDWVDRFGEEKATEMLVIARAAHCSTKEAPVGLKITQQLFTGLEQARATARIGNQASTVVVVVGAQPPALPSMPAPRLGDD